MTACTSLGLDSQTISPDLYFINDAFIHYAFVARNWNEDNVIAAAWYFSARIAYPTDFVKSPDGLTADEIDMLNRLSDNELTHRREKALKD